MLYYTINLVYNCFLHNNSVKNFFEIFYLNRICIKKFFVFLFFLLMESTHEIFCPTIIEIHQISSLLKEFEELKIIYQTDNELEINKNLESTPISQESDAYSSDEVLEDEDNKILTS